MFQVLQTTILQAKIRKCCFQALSTESLSVSMSPLRVSHKFQLLFHPTLFSILEDGGRTVRFYFILGYMYFFCCTNYLFLSATLFLSMIYFPVKEGQEKASFKYASK